MPTEEEISYHLLSHADFGYIRGVRRSKTVNQYLGIQYSILKDRFSRGELLEPTQLESCRGSDGILDATHFGPIPLNLPDGCDLEQRLIQKSLPFSQFEQSDTQCLTLNITAPHVTNDSLFPVLVFVHGGGFMTGSSCYPQNDLAPITMISLQIGTPIVSVSINYRIGAPGFLYSPEMEIAGYRPNNGLEDQRLGLYWIRRYISGFGGDPERVTFLGESAGAAAGFFHLHLAEPLFHQLVTMSGTSLLRPRSVEQAEKTFGYVAEVLGAKDLPADKQIQRLLDIPQEEFTAKVGRKFTIGAIVKGDHIPKATTFESLSNEDSLLDLFPGIRRCKRIIIGDCQMDGMIWDHRLAARTDIFPRSLEQCMSVVFDPIDIKITPTILSAYGIDPATQTNTKETTLSVLNFGNDISFALPAIRFAQAWSASSITGTEAFLYHFNCPNPWDGPWKGHAIHVQDLMFVLQNYRDQLAPGQQHCAKRFAKEVIAFVHGMEPWPAYQSGADSGSMVYSARLEGDIDESMFVLDEASDQTGRRNILQNLVEEKLFDKLLDVWQMFLNGPQ